MGDIYKNVKENNSSKKRKILIFFDDMIVDMSSNKKFNPTVTELFLRGGKVNKFILFLLQNLILLCQKILD